MVSLLNNLFKNLGRKAATRRYPFVKRELPRGTRGHLDVDIETCIFCGACQKRCPANALAVSRAPRSWSVNHFACILCGHCVDVCPKKCLTFHTVHFPAN